MVRSRQHDMQRAFAVPSGKDLPSASQDASHGRNNARPVSWQRESSLLAGEAGLCSSFKQVVLSFKKCVRRDYPRPVIRRQMKLGLCFKMCDLVSPANQEGGDFKQGAEKRHLRPLEDNSGQNRAFSAFKIAPKHPEAPIASTFEAQSTQKGEMRPEFLRGGRYSPFWAFRGCRRGFARLSA